MAKENTHCTSEVRVTRARARTIARTGGLPPLHPSVKLEVNEKKTLHLNLKRAESDTGPLASSRQRKKRAVLGDVTNLVCENSYISCKNATKNLLCKQGKKGSVKSKAKVVPSVSGETLQIKEAKKEKVNEESKLATEEEEGEEVSSIEKVQQQLPIQSSESLNLEECSPPNLMRTKQNCGKNRRQQSLSVIESRFNLKKQALDELGITDIDSKHKDPLMCGVYAPSIYQNLNVLELDQRPSIDYIEVLQQDIHQGMRGILIDWLVEVSEEYGLVPDTLYLTVNLIDRFLSGNYIEKQKLQLLGVTCMLIASKYEEICAPRVEEFCFITDNTYAKEEVVKMENMVLNFLDFRLSVPTTKKFLRRFIQAAQVSYKVPSVELEFLANYLAELTLLEYSFLKYLPSLIAASAVFLARWTIDQSNNPWNPTLEHYSNYKALDLKTTVLALQDLQLNTNGCTLNSIRDKYTQEKFKSVASLRSSRPVQSLF